MQGFHLIRARKSKFGGIRFVPSLSRDNLNKVGSPGMDFNHPPLPPAGCLSRTLESSLPKLSGNLKAGAWLDAGTVFRVVDRLVDSDGL